MEDKIKSLITKAANAHKSYDAELFAKAALDAAQALKVLSYIRPNSSRPYEPVDMSF